MTRAPAGDRPRPSWHASCEIRIGARARAARWQAWRRGWSCGARGVAALRSFAANRDWAALGALATWNTFLRGARVRVCGLKEGCGSQTPTGGFNPSRGPKVACTTSPEATPGLLDGQRCSPGGAASGHCTSHCEAKAVDGQIRLRSCREVREEG